jgi:hypothetical protein
VVLIAFPEGVPADFLDTLDTATAALANAVPEILDAAWGRDATGNGDDFGYALSFDFADEAAYERYRIHPAHQQYIRDFMRSVPMEKVRVRFELPPQQARKQTA